LIAEGDDAIDHADGDAADEELGENLHRRVPYPTKIPLPLPGENTDSGKQWKSKP
jgi:hypothetical protein